MKVSGALPSGLNSIFSVLRPFVVSDETFVIKPSLTDFLLARIGSTRNVSAFGPVNHLNGIVGLLAVRSRSRAKLSR